MDATQFAELCDLLKQLTGFLSGCVLATILASTWKG